MSLENFITDMLNIELDMIEKIASLKQSDGSIVIKIRLVRNKNEYCPLCQQKVKIHGYYSKKLIHSTLANRKCTIIYEQRRYRCDLCEYTFHEKNPFANVNDNLTYETKINILNDLKYVNSTYTSVALRYNVSVTQVTRLFDKHVDINRKALPEVLSIDEHYFPESDYDSLYCCLLMDFDSGILVDILPDRKKDYLKYYFDKIRIQTLNEQNKTSELDNVKYVSMDMYEPYKDIAELYFPTALICADSFHVIKHLTDAFKQIRLRCRRQTQDENLKWLITKFKFVFNHEQHLDNKPKYNKRFGMTMNFRDIQFLLFERFPDLKIAYDLKENYIYFNETATYENAPELLTDLIKSFADSNIPEYDEFYNLLIHWYKEIINSFIVYNNRRINNSYIESKNRQLDRLMFNANGFQNFKRTRNRILYCLNKNDTFKI